MADSKLATDACADRFSCTPIKYFHPTTVDEIRNIVIEARNEGKKVRLHAYKHATNASRLTDDYLIDMTRFARVIHIDKEHLTVKVEAGMSFATLNEHVYRRGLSIPVMPGFDDISIGGAVVTSSHGSGTKWGSISSLVVELELLTADGKVLKLSRKTDEETFRAAVVSLGVLGIVLTVTMQCVPAFKLQADSRHVKVEDVLSDVRKTVASNDYLTLMWCTSNPDDFLMVTYTVVPDETETMGAMDICIVSETMNAEAIGLHRIDASYKILASLRGSTDKLFNSILGFVLPVDVIGELLKRLRMWMKESGFEQVNTIEIRFVKGDDLMLSPFYGRDSVTVGTCALKDAIVKDGWFEWFAALSDVALQLGGRPHWGKDVRVTLDQLKPMYPEWERFQAVRRRLDPQNTFSNAFINSVLGPVGRSVSDKGATDSE